MKCAWSASLARDITLYHIPSMISMIICTYKICNLIMLLIIMLISVTIGTTPKTRTPTRPLMRCLRDLMWPAPHEIGPAPVVSMARHLEDALVSSLSALHPAALCVRPGGTPGLPVQFRTRRVIRVEAADMWRSRSARVRRKLPKSEVTWPREPKSDAVDPRASRVSTRSP